MRSDADLLQKNIGRRLNHEDLSHHKHDKESNNGEQEVDEDAVDNTVSW